MIKKIPQIPSQNDEEMLNGILRVLHDLGGYAHRRDILKRLAEDLNLTPEQRNLPSETNDNRSQFDYNTDWTRNTLKICGLLESPKRNYWALTEKGYKTTRIPKRDALDCLKKYQKISKKSSNLNTNSFGNSIFNLENTWKDTILDKLKSITPRQFEFFCQNLLRQLSIEDVKLTPESRDGGIDGSGRLVVNDLISFKIAFECKRYVNKVGLENLQKFKGACMNHRVDKGLLITTSFFTADAKEFAENNNIDLTDGFQLCDKMLDCELGVKKMIVGDLDGIYFDRLG